MRGGKGGGREPRVRVAAQGGGKRAGDTSRDSATPAGGRGRRRARCARAGPGPGDAGDASHARGADRPRPALARLRASYVAGSSDTQHAFRQQGSGNTPLAHTLVSLSRCWPRSRRSSSAHAGESVAAGLGLGTSLAHAGEPCLSPGRLVSASRALPAAPLLASGGRPHAARCSCAKASVPSQARGRLLLSETAESPSADTRYTIHEPEKRSNVTAGA